MVSQRITGPVLVTGTSTGIGRAIVESLSRQGHSVLACARKDTDLRELHRLRNVKAVRLDVTSPEHVRAAAEWIRKDGKGLHGLVNNAGIVDFWPLGETSDEDLRRSFEVNVLGVHRLTRTMLPFLIESRGRLVNISSISGLGTSARIGAYSMTKHAIEAFSEAMARQLERYGVRVSVIEPGNYRSNIMTPAVDIARRRAAVATSFVMKQEVENVLGILDEELRLQVESAPPDPVAEAVSDALFSENPRPRYVITPNEEEFLWPLEELLWRTVLANRGGTNPLPKERLHSLLDKAWERTGIL